MRVTFDGKDFRTIYRTPSFEGLSCRYANFRGTNLVGASFREADCRGADFSNADLRESDFWDAIIIDANFSNASIEGAQFDLYGIPVIADIHRRVYEAASQPGAIDVHNWHLSETCHSWAGWVVTLAGDEGRQLERRIGTPAAAMLIYLASDPGLKEIPNFYLPKHYALDVMQVLALQSGKEER